MTASKIRPTDKTATPAIAASADTPSINQLVRERLELSETADFHALMDELVEELPTELLQAAARRGLYTLARDAARQGLRPRPKPSGSGKWDRVAQAERERPDIFGERICVGEADGRGLWKFLGDCTKADLAGAEELKRAHAAGVEAAADRFARLGKLLKANQKVRDVERSRVEAIFNA